MIEKRSGRLSPDGIKAVFDYLEQKSECLPVSDENLQSTSSGWTDRQRVAVTSTGDDLRSGRHSSTSGLSATDCSTLRAHSTKLLTETTTCTNVCKSISFTSVFSLLRTREGGAVEGTAKLGDSKKGAVDEHWCRIRRSQVSAISDGCRYTKSH